MMRTQGLRAVDLALADACSGFEALRPPDRVSVSEGAGRVLVVAQPGAPSSSWSAQNTPYMVEPMDSLASRKHEAVVFVGPARTGKTMGLLLGWLAHNVVHDPGDMLFVQMSKDKAREFSKTDVDRAIRHSPAVRAMKSPRPIDSNTFDTMFRHGMWVRIAWPTVSNVSGSTYRYVAITDIDRIDNAENVDGEGPLFDLAKKRTTTFLSRGMTLVESSPGHPMVDPAWRAATRHEAPPVAGILSLYNRSDRRRFYWRCLHCGQWFEAAPGLDLFRLPDFDTLLADVRTMDIEGFAKERAQVWCPHCGGAMGQQDKMALNLGGVWLPDGCTVSGEGQIGGEAMRAAIKGYWLGGVAAAYQSWESLIAQYLYGVREYALTGSEQKLKQTTNTDQGMPYMERRLLEMRGRAGGPLERAEVGLPRWVVPDEARCVLVSVDVQGGQNAHFDVQVHAVGPMGEQWVIDRRKIKQSQREGMDLGEFAPIDPASYPEDWDVLTETVVRATWRTNIEGVEMLACAVIVDSGGEAGAALRDGEVVEDKVGVTQNAYAWYRRIRAAGLGRRVFLYKGGSVRNAPDVKETHVGKISGRGVNDIPLLLCNTNKLSDMVDAGLRRATVGAGYIHLPAPRNAATNPDGWMSPAFFDELQAEVRGTDGVWRKIRKRNESFDHMRMQQALLLRLGILRLRDWNNPPDWLAPVERNSLCIRKQERREMKEDATVSGPEASAVQALAPPKPAIRQRRFSVPDL